jgi:hypothetical protein
MLFVFSVSEDTRVFLGAQMMSVAIILRSTVHVNQFRVDTGKLVCDNQSSESSMKDASDILINTQRANELKMVFCTHIKPKLNC